MRLGDRGFISLESDDDGKELNRQCVDSIADIRSLDGRHMHDATGVFDECADALEFPDYFGKNWGALDECIADLDWLPGTSYLIIVPHANEVLANEAKPGKNTFFRILETVGREWGTAVELGEVWDRLARPFHSVLIARQEFIPELEEKLTAVGIEISLLNHPLKER